MSLAKNTAYYSVGTILPRLGAFVFLPIYLRYLSPTEYGIVTSMHVLNGVLVIIFTLALNRSLYRIFYDYTSQSDRQKLIGTVFVSILIIALSQLLIILTLNRVFNKIYPEISFFPYYLYSLFAVFLISLQTIPQAILQIKEQAKTFISLSLMLFFLKSGLVLFFLIFMKEEAVGYLKADVLSELVIVPIYYYFIRKDFRIAWNYKIFLNVLTFSLPILPNVLSAWVLGLSDRIFISKYFTTADVGIYSLGYQVAGLVLVFTTAFKTAYDPYFFKIANTREKADAVKILYKTNSVFLIILIIISFGLAFFAREGIMIFFTEAYYPSIQIVPIISLGYLFSQNSALLNTMVYQEKKTRVVMYITLISAALNITLNLILIPVWGILGAAFVALISFFIVFILSYLLAKKYFFIPYNWGQLVPVFLSCIALYFLFTVIEFSNIYYSLIIKIGAVLGIASIVFYRYKKVIFEIIRKD